MPSRTSVLIFFSSLLLSAAPSFAADCVEDIEQSANPTQALIACLRELEGENRQLLEKVRVLEESLPPLSEDRVKVLVGEVVSGSAVPAGAVIAFDSPCPGGWERFWPASARTIVGAVGQDEIGSVPSQFSRTESDKLISARPLQSIGGEEQTVLIKENLPTHEHNYVGAKTAAHVNAGIPHTYIQFGSDAGLVLENFTTTGSGEAKSFTNMVPFVALNYCRKLEQ